MAQAVLSNNKPQKNTAIGDAILAALADAGKSADDITVAPAKPRRERRIIRRGDKNKPTSVRRNRRNNDNYNGDENHQKSVMKQRVGIGWEHTLGEITVSVDQADCENTTDTGPYTSAKLMFVEGEWKPEMLNVRIKCDPAEQDLMVYSIQGGTRLRRINAGKENLPALNIPVDWSEGYPQTRKAHEDNCGILLMDSIGRFVHLEVGVTVRRNWLGKWAIFLNLQEMFTGQVVRSTKARIRDLGLSYVESEGKMATVIPLYSYHAYPGNNWLGTNPVNVWGVDTIVPKALAEGRSVALYQASYDAWTPPEMGTPSKEGRVRAVVHFYNCAWLGGAGFAVTEDGQNVFLHWANLRGGLYAPQPMSIVEFTWGEHNGKPQAKNIHAV